MLTYREATPYHSIQLLHLGHEFSSQPGQLRHLPVNAGLSAGDNTLSKPNHFITGVKTGYPGQAPSNGVTGPTSQIPGLCQEATEGAPEARTSGRRVGIFDSDSDYVKLAKGGGQKGNNVLCHSYVLLYSRYMLYTSVCGHYYGLIGHRLVWL